jgi:predicted Zn-dependent peptidase
MWYRAGARDERPGRTGLAFLVEQLNMRGPAGSPPEERLRRLAAAGGVATSVTTADYTCYQVTLPREQLETALRTEAERMADLRVTPGDLRVQRDLAMARIRKRAQTPGARGLDRLYQTAFVKHPYGSAAAGRAEDLGAVTLEECRDFFAAHYAPGNAVLTVTGDFDPAEALKWARRYFVAPRRPAPQRPAAAEPAQEGERRAEERMTTDVPLLFVGWPSLPDSSADAASLELLSNLLVRGRASRLQQALVAGSGLCVQVHGAMDGRRESAMFYVGVALAPGAAREEVERALLGEVDRLRTEPIASQEVARCRNQAEASLMLNWQSVQNRGQWLGQGAVRFGDPRAVLTRLARLRAADAEKLRRVAEAYLKPERRSVVWVVPEVAGAGGSP